jgi:hypothetical protein
VSNNPFGAAVPKRRQAIKRKFRLVATALVLSVVSAPPARSQTRTEIAPRPNTASPAAGAESETDAPVTDCDKYAASPLDPERKAEGVSSDKVVRRA